MCIRDSGITWTARTSGTADNLVSVAHNGIGTISAIGATNYLAPYSLDDGATWAASTYGSIHAGNPLQAIYSTLLKQFVSVGISNHLRMSYDGILWSDCNETVGNIYSIAETANGFLFGGPTGRIDLVIGDNWMHRRSLPILTGAASFTACVFVTTAGRILVGQDDNYNGVYMAEYSYNSATSFRVPSPTLDPGIYSDTWILGD